MAYETGTATSGLDLYNKLRTFLTTNAALVSAGQNWTEVWEAPVGAENETDCVVKGPGLSGTDAIYVCMRYATNVGDDAYWIETRGATGVLAGAEEYDGHVNVTPSPVRMFADSGTVNYHFIANGRRFMVVVKVSTTFESMYAGFMLPYATPLSYPYPLVIGGSAGPENENGPINWRSINDNHSHFVNPNYDSGATPVDTALWVINPAGAWARASGNGDETPMGVLPERSGGDYFYDEDSPPANYSLHSSWVLERLMSAFGGDRALIPCTLIGYGDATQTYGILDGAYRCQGYANAAENKITVGAKDYLVVPNVYRSDFGDYWAAIME